MTFFFFFLDNDIQHNNNSTIRYCKEKPNSWVLLKSVFRIVFICVWKPCTIVQPESQGDFIRLLFCKATLSELCGTVHEQKLTLYRTLLDGFINWAVNWEAEKCRWVKD